MLRLPMSDTIAQLQRYRGCQAGWQPIGGLRSADDAARLRNLLQRITPSATLRISSVA